ncbi:MAG: tetratricopeptide (TPR) repeat protein [Verrucomicrobiales bacterium]|jgi:tetratricopeptide (TPR) repeat protein
MEQSEAKDLIDSLTDEPENWDVRCKAAEILSMEGRNGEAVALLDAAPNLPEFETHILKIAEIYSKTEPGKAVPLLHAFLQECRDSALGHLAMAEVAGKLGDTHGAGQYYACALEINKAYRDPDFETKYGIKLGDLPPPMTAKTESVPLPGEEASTKTAAGGSAAADGEDSSASGRRAKKSGRGGSWIIATLTAIGVFVICWLVLLAIIRSMASPT